MISGLESAKLKLGRVPKYIDAIEASIRTYAAGATHEFVTDADGKQKINIISQPPPEISVLSGEVVYQIRSALDHLVFDLVKLNPGVVSIDPLWDEHCEFPLWISAPRGATPPLDQNHFKRCLPGISAQAFEFIESMQPYYPSGAPNTWFRFLAKLSNIDKHRHLNLTTTRIRKNELVSLDSGAGHGSFAVLDHGTELEAIIGNDYPMGRAVEVKRSFAPLVTFDESTLGAASSLPVEYVLQQCAYTVNSMIVPAFEKFIQTP
jgi:hypothetical protein